MGSAARGGGLHQGGGGSATRGGLGRPPRDTWDTTGHCQQAGGTHPTVMLFCFNLMFVVVQKTSVIFLYLCEIDIIDRNRQGGVNGKSNFLALIIFFA